MKKNRLDVYKNILSKNCRKLTLTVSGNSMFPLLKNGDKVEIKTYDKLDNIFINNIIVYKKFDTHLTIHRVKEIIKFGNNHKCYITKGDNNDENDDYVVFENEILGILLDKEGDFYENNK
ncbi:signal peptidase I (plasmid) [Clostridium perfringens]|uniref:signal peptidase I n=1 Tax=Clostridium perfringens TaxID=1502 RepID=UPI0030CEFEF1